MRKLFIFLPLFFCLNAWSAVTHVKSDGGYCGSGSLHAGNIASSCISPAATKTFTFTPTNANDAVLIYVGCGSGVTRTSVTLTSPGWTITALSPITGASANGWGASFGAISPNTSAATFTVTWDGSCNSFMNDLMDEFTGIDTTGGTTTFDAHNQSTASSGSCTLSVTPGNNNDAVWFACADSVTACTSPYACGADDTQQDVSEWQILSGGSGTPKASAWTSASGAYVISGVSIKPASAGAVVRHRAVVIQR